MFEPGAPLSFRPRDAGDPPPFVRARRTGPLQKEELLTPWRGRNTFPLWKRTSTDWETSTADDLDGFGRSYRSKASDHMRHTDHPAAFDATRNVYMWKTLTGLEFLTFDVSCFHT